MKQVVSAARFNKYIAFCKSDQAAASQMYMDNLRLCKALFPLLHFFEITLRNQVDERLKYGYNTDRWWEAWNDPVFDGLLNKIHDCELQFLDRGGNAEDMTHDDVVAGLSLGFWVSFFNARYERHLWKLMRFVFRNLEKRNRRLSKVSPHINRLHKLRNRVFHHEPISWNLEALRHSYDNGRQLLGWMSQDALEYLDECCDFTEAWEEIHESRK